MADEVWRPVNGYEGLYEVSDQASVKSLDRTIQTTRGPRRIRGRLLKPKANSSGYLQIALFKDRKRKEKLLSRVVAEAFCEKPDGCNIVNHLDCDISHNWASNLEWTTDLGNVRHAIEHQRRPVRPVLRGDDKLYPMLTMVEADGYSSSAVCQVCRGKLKTHKGQTFRYAGIGDGIHDREGGGRYATHST